jgi:hypothetical protein
VTIAPTVTIVPPPTAQSQSVASGVADHEEPLADEAPVVIAPIVPVPIAAPRTAIAIPTAPPKVLSSRIITPSAVVSTARAIHTPSNTIAPPATTTAHSLLATRDEEAANVLSLRTLIKSKFDEGKISKFEELRRTQMAEQRKKRKMDRAVKGQEKAERVQQLEQSSSQEEQDETSTVDESSSKIGEVESQPEPSPMRTR